MENNVLARDLDEILVHTQPLWEELRHQSIFITGGTGFFGCWLLESLAWVNAKLGLQIKAVILTRNVAHFAKKCPHLVNHPALRFHEGDVTNFTFPAGEFSHIIHAATEVNRGIDAEQSLTTLNTILRGTQHTLTFAKACGVKRFLYVSSGAVYGRQPHEMTHLPEDYQCQPDAKSSAHAYGVGKFTAEYLSCLYGNQYGFAVKIARCFAFVGPYLPLDGSYAIGNFIRDSLADKPILVNSDGTSYRSYLYAADLAVWLWTILIKGSPARPYNVGSEEAVSIGELARLIANSGEPPSPIIQLQQAPVIGKQPERYVPSTKRAMQELDLQQRTSLSDAIRKTKKWHARQNSMAYST